MMMDGDDLTCQRMCHVIQTVMAHVIAVHINQGECTSPPSFLFSHEKQGPCHQWRCGNQQLTNNNDTWMNDDNTWTNNNDTLTDDDMACQQMCHVVQMVTTHVVITVHIDPGEQRDSEGEILTNETHGRFHHHVSM